MIQYLPVILICAATTPINECVEEKLDRSYVIHGELSNGPTSCFMSSQALVASTGISPADDKYYIRVKCIPKESG